MKKKEESSFNPREGSSRLLQAASPDKILPSSRRRREEGSKPVWQAKWPHPPPLKVLLLERLKTQERAKHVQKFYNYRGPLGSIPLFKTFPRESSLQPITLKRGKENAFSLPHNSSLLALLFLLKTYPWNAGNCLIKLFLCFSFLYLWLHINR